MTKKNDEAAAVTDAQVATPDGPTEPAIVEPFKLYEVKGVDQPLRLSPEHAAELGAKPVE